MRIDFPRSLRIGILVVIEFLKKFYENEITLVDTKEVLFRVGEIITIYHKTYCFHLDNGMTVTIEVIDCADPTACGNVTISDPDGWIIARAHFSWKNNTLVITDVKVLRHKMSLLNVDETIKNVTIVNSW
jgi:hypothetical protein